MKGTRTATKQAAITRRPVIIFTMGLPASGKSTWIRRHLAGVPVLDPDAIKASHPDFDPTCPQALHAWSQDETESRWNAHLDGRAASGDLILDGTGCNAEKMARRIDQAHAAGFRCRLVFLVLDAETCIARNAARERVVPEHIIRSKALDIETAWTILSPMVETATRVEQRS